MIRIYGPMDGTSSWPVVARGISEGLRGECKLAGVQDLNDLDRGDQDDVITEGFDADVGICIGPPLAASVMKSRGAHRHRLMMIAANSSWLPEAVMMQIRQIATALVAPSYWAAEVVRSYSGDLPVYIYHHGVDDGFYPSTEAPDERCWDVLHLTSTYMQRKGTRELIYGWSEAMSEGWIPEHARLRIVADGSRGRFDQDIYEATLGKKRIVDSYEILPRLGLSVKQARSLYCKHHAICQPSRGEGFGMVPLEARACGVPVIATQASGHLDHVHGDGVEVICHGDDSPIDDGPGALAPSVECSDVADALRRAYDGREQLFDGAQRQAKELRELWSWSSVTRSFLARYGKDLGI